jgi:L,D-transpeptidase ErfK/SrfK
MRYLIAFILILSACGASSAATHPLPALSKALVGSEFQYTAKAGDSLASLSSRYGIKPNVLTWRNYLTSHSRILPGDVLTIDNRHIVPEVLNDGIVINIPQRFLFYFRQGQVDSYYPVGLGQADWRTPSRAFTIVSREKDKTWYVPSSIQREMRQKGQRVRTHVPPGPRNPLGRYWLGLSIPRVGIHATIAPQSIYQFRTHGCIRLHPDDAEDLWNKVAIGDPGEIIYQPVLLARLHDGRIFLEVHRDIYRSAGSPLAQVHAMAERDDLTGHIDWDRVQEVLNESTEIA